jgi:hypothetical protein
VLKRVGRVVVPHEAIRAQTRGCGIRGRM